MSFGTAPFPRFRPAARPGALGIAVALAVVLATGLAWPTPAAATVAFPGPRTAALPSAGLSALAVRLPGDQTDHLLVGMADGSLALVRYLPVSRSFEIRQRLFLDGRLVGLAPWEGLPLSQRGVVVAAADPDRVLFVRVADRYPYLQTVSTVDLDEDPGAMAWFGSLGAGDGRLAVAVPGLDAVAVLADRGGWRLDRLVPVGDEPRSLTAADLDGDDVPEVVVAERGALSGDLAVLAAGPDGTVTSRFTRVAGVEAGLVALCDAAGDGGVEVVLADRARPVVYFARASGDGFAVQDSLTLTMPAEQLLTWTLADGTPGLLVGSATRGAVEFASRTAGGWVRHENYFPGCSPAASATAEMDGDGLPDIASVAAGQPLLSLMMALPGPGFSGLPSLTLTALPGDLAFGDFDGDGRGDVLVPAAVEARLSLFSARDGGVQTVPREVPLAFAPGRVAAVELDGDAASELVALDIIAGQVVVLDADGAGGFTETQRRDVGDYPNFVTAGDIDGDGFVDLLVLAADRSRVLLLYGEPGGTFTEPVAIAYDIETLRAALPDLNGDGRLDLVGLDGVNRLWWRLNLGGRTFGPGQWAHAGLGAALLATGDLDGDLDVDVVVGCRLDQSLVSFQNDGAGGLARRSGSYILGSEPTGLRIGDFDHDGRGDVVVGLREQDRFDIYLGFVPWNHEFALAVPGTPDVLEFNITDVNADGTADLLALDSTLRLGVAHLNIDPAGVAVEPRALQVSCRDDGGLEARLEPGAGGPWRLDARLPAGWRNLADPDGAATGRLEQEGAAWRLVLAPGDLDRWGRPAELRLTVSRADGSAESRRQDVAAPCGGAVAGASASGPSWVTGPWPNPGNPSVRATFRLPRRDRVRVAVFDLAGRRVALLAEGELGAGDHEVTWDGRTPGGAAAAGTYLLRLETSAGVDGRKVVLLK